MIVSQSDFDFDIADPGAAEKSVPSYPVAQWLNGQQALKALGGVYYRGGMVLPKKNLSDGARFPGWTEKKITFRRGKEENALTAVKVVVAPVRTRFRWFARQGTETVYYPRGAYVMGAHMRGHLQELSAVKGADEQLLSPSKARRRKHSRHS